MRMVAVALLAGAARANCHIRTIRPESPGVTTIKSGSVSAVCCGSDPMQRRPVRKQPQVCHLLQGDWGLRSALRLRGSSTLGKLGRFREHGVGTPS